ncbi:MAG TPA: hypothetical protein VGC57_08365 [Cellulomonas sp.]
MILVAILLALLLAALVVVVVRTIRLDGYGSRRPPASHPDWWDPPPQA